MGKVSVVCVVGFSFALAVPAEAGSTYNLLPGPGSSWQQDPAAGGDFSSVYANALLDGGGGLIVDGLKWPGASAAILPGEDYYGVFDWRTSYDPVVLSIWAGTDSWTASDFASLSFTNYNNNVGGLPSEFLFVGEGDLLDGRSVYFEASWDASAGLTLVPTFPEFEPVGGPLVAGYLEIGDLPPGVIPEPATLLGVGLAVMGLGGYLRRRKLA